MGIRETGWGLGFYRVTGLGFERGLDGGDPWHSRLGHAAHIRVRQHGGGGGHGGRRELLAPPRRASQERMQRGKERWGKG
jgi:hypothetical protein